jgi:hypothetical protein
MIHLPPSDPAAVERGLCAVFDEICYSNDDGDYILDCWVYHIDIPRLVDVFARASAMKGREERGEVGT